jgi:hypothetical protein
VLSNTHEAAESKLLTMYPNPTSSEINLNADPSLTGSQYIISDSSGRNVMIGMISAEPKRIDIRHLPPGIYVVRVGSSNSVSFIKK